MSGAGEVVTFTEASVDFAKLRLIAEALVTAALPAAAADLFALGLSAGAQVHAACLTLLTLTAGAQVPRLTVACSTRVCANGAAHAAVGLCSLGAPAVTLIVHRHFQTVFKSHWFYSESLVCPSRRTTPCFHADIK